MSSKLSIKIIFIISAVLFLSAVLTSGYIIRSERNILLKRAYSEAENINRRIFDSLVAIMALGVRDPEAVHNVIAEIRAKEEEKESDILEIRLIHPPDIAETFRDEKIAKEYKPRESEHPKDEIEKQALSGKFFKGETLVNIKGRNLRAIRYITPVKAEKRCLACHTIQEGITLAALSSVISLEPIYQAIRQRTIENMLLLGIGFIFILIILYFSLNRLVVKPVLAVSKTAQTIAKEKDLSKRVKIESEDEIGELAASFNKMVLDLQHSYDEVNRAKELTEAIAEGVEEGIMLLSRDFRILWANKKIIEMSGIGKNDIINETCYEATHHVNSPCKSPFDLCPIEDVLKTGKSKTVEHKHYDKDGNEFIVEVTVYPIKDDKGNTSRFIHVTRDITEKKMLESELMQAEKMSALGLLSTGVAHEVKNPLAIISQGVDYLDKAETLDKIRQTGVLAILKDAINRAEIIIHDLLTFSRKSALEIKPENINEVIALSLNLVKNDPAFKNIKLVKDYSDNLPGVFVDKNKMQQVFLNIILNAIQAMPREGTLTVRTYMKELTKIGEGVGRRAQDLFQLGEKVIFVEMEDTGPGIAKENIAKIFTPFFTTKGPGKGVGLGLSITKTIVDSHKGLIKIESQESKGTKFIVILPIEKK